MFSAENVIGVTASVFTAISMLPQLLKVFREKSAEGTSYLMIVTLFIGISGWVIYGFLIDDLIILVSNAVAWCIISTVGILCILYRGSRPSASVSAKKIT